MAIWGKGGGWEEQLEFPSFSWDDLMTHGGGEAN